VKEDSRALLKLLLESGQSYDDIAGVLAVDRERVRERARDALAELGGERPDPELTDYLLGEATPVERAEMARRLSADEREASRASGLAEKLREIAPRASLPALPAAPADSPGVRTAPRDPEDAEDTGSPGSRARLVLALAAIAILLAGVVVAATGVFGGDDDAAVPESEVSLEDLDAISVELDPIGDGEASGEAVLGLATADQPFVDLSLNGLEPIEASDAYIVWLMVSEERGWPLGLVEPDQEGTQSERYPVPAFLLSTNIIKGLREIVVSRSPRQEAFEAADEAAKSGVPEVNFVGEPVLSGSVPSTGSIAPQGGG
jgi:hypothetical protein